MKYLIAILLFILSSLSLMAQEVRSLEADAPLPSNHSEFWTYGIAALIPVLLTFLKWLAPNIPKWVLPVSTPLLGIALGAALNALGKAEFSWVDMAQAGGLAVFVRETWNQIVTKAMSDGPAGSDARLDEKRK